MNTQQIVGLIQQKFNTALKSKTGWGRNELVLLHSNIIVEVLALAIDDKYPDASGDAIEVDRHDITLIDEESDMFTDEYRLEHFQTREDVIAHDFNEACGDR